VPQYVIERHFGPIRYADLDEPAWVARREAAFAAYPEIVWHHSHIAETADDLVTFCVYEAPSAQYCRDHAAAAGVPADVVHESFVVSPGD
jgi:hypothetical protein